MKENIDLKREISELGFESQKKFAEFMGVSPRTVNRWCRGFSKVPKEAILLCFVLREEQRIERELEGLIRKGYLFKGIGPKNCPSYKEVWKLIQKVKAISSAPKL